MVECLLGRQLLGGEVRIGYRGSDKGHIAADWHLVRVSTFIQLLHLFVHLPIEFSFIELVLLLLVRPDDSRLLKQG